MIPYCLDSRLTDGGYVVSLMRVPRSTLQKCFIVIISVGSRVNLRAIAQLGGISKLQNFSDL
jgi:hypothetical protein